MNARPHYKWWLVLMLWFTCFFNYADRQAIFSVFPLLKTEMGLSDVQLGIVGGSFMWVYAACGPLAGLIGDRMRRKTLIITGLVFWSLVTIGGSLKTSFAAAKMVTNPAKLPVHPGALRYYREKGLLK